jgi:hypothetical protein
MRGETSDYTVVNFIKRVRDALHQMDSKVWKEVITKNTELDYSPGVMINT